MCLRVGNELTALLQFSTCLVPLKILAVCKVLCKNDLIVKIIYCAQILLLQQSREKKQ